MIYKVITLLHTCIDVLCLTQSLSAKFSIVTNHLTGLSFLPVLIKTWLQNRKLLLIKIVITHKMTREINDKDFFPLG